MLTFRIVGFGEVISVLDPALISEVFMGDSDVLRAGEANAQALGPLGPDSPPVLDGERHLRTRRLLLPPFHGEAIRHHQQLIERITVEGGPALAASGAVRAMATDARDHTLRSSCRP